MPGSSFRAPAALIVGSLAQREVQLEPVRQVRDLAKECFGHCAGETDVLVDRMDPQPPGRAVGGGRACPPAGRRTGSAGRTTRTGAWQQACTSPSKRT